MLAVRALKSAQIFVQAERLDADNPHFGAA